MRADERPQVVLGLQSASIDPEDVHDVYAVSDDVSLSGQRLVCSRTSMPHFEILSLHVGDDSIPFRRIETDGPTEFAFEAEIRAKVPVKVSVKNTDDKPHVFYAAVFGYPS